MPFPRLRADHTSFGLFRSYPAVTQLPVTGVSDTHELLLPSQGPGIVDG
jgi:hypothetical protein